MRKILVLRFNGIRYGVREDKIAEVHTAQSFHPLPFSPPEIAGIARINERNAVIANLDVCLGRSPKANSRNTTFLILNPEKDIAGFSVSEITEIITCPADSLLPLPIRSKRHAGITLHEDSVLPVFLPKGLPGSDRRRSSSASHV